MPYKHYIRTGSSLIIVTTEGLKPVTSDHQNFQRIEEALNRGDYQRALDLIDIRENLTQHPSGRFMLKDGVIFLDNEKLPQQLSERILQLVDANLPYDSLLKFWDNVKQNPNNDSKQDLYGFLEQKGIPITEDGCFLAYKKVREDFKDGYSGKYDNSPGAVVKMPREECDSCRDNECSRGLHVAAWDYAQGYSGVKLILVKVNPKDVVAVPRDYHGQKMRTCEYIVLNEVKQEIKEPLATATGVPVQPIPQDDEQDDFEDEDDPFDDEDDDEDEDDEDDDEDLDDDDDEEDEEEQSEYTVRLADNGRLTIPAALVRRLGVDRGGTCYAVVGNKKITFTPDAPTTRGGEAKVFRADSYWNLRVRKRFLLDAGFRRKTYTVVGDDEKIVLSE